jgi:hypothetical protein
VIPVVLSGWINPLLLFYLLSCVVKRLNRTRPFIAGAIAVRCVAMWIQLAADHVALQPGHYQLPCPGMGTSCGRGALRQEAGSSCLSVAHASECQDLWLSENRAGDPLPPGRITPPHVHREALANDQQRQRKEIRLVDAPIYQQIARNAEKDQQVQAREEEIVVEQVVKAAKGRVHEPAGCDEDQPAMQLRFHAPIDGKRNAHAKGDHVVERDAQKSTRAALMELNGVKAGHDDGSSNAQRNHHRRQPGAKPSDGAVPTEFAYTDQRGLTNEEDHPPGESCAMNPENEGPRHGGMEQVGVDGTLETGDHNRRDQQRHREIEISMQNLVTTSHGRRAQFFSGLIAGPTRSALTVDMEG